MEEKLMQCPVATDREITS